MNVASTVSSNINSIESIGQNINSPATKQLETREAFQDFVASTFYKEMLKSLRDTENKPAYFHGGNTEDIFQGQFDQQIAEDLAKDHGGVMADPLYPQFVLQLARK